MSYATIGSIKINHHSTEQDFISIPLRVAHNNRPLSNISNKCMTKTISTFFFPTDKIPQSIDERRYQKPFVSKSFYAKNRKMLESSLASKKKKLSQTKWDDLTQANLNKTLKAKSTVIKKKRFHQFYINKENQTSLLEEEMKIKQNFKTNLFKSNFAMKKKRARNNSLNNQNMTKLVDTLDFSYENIKMALRISKEPIQKADDFILQQKNMNTLMAQYIKSVNKKGLQERLKELENSSWKESSYKKQSSSRKQTNNKKPYNKKQHKQNTQFDLAPWNNSQFDDSTF